MTHTIESIKRNAIESAIANGAANNTAELHAYAFGYLSAYLADALNQIDAIEAARQSSPSIEDMPVWLKRQAE